MSGIRSYHAAPPAEASVAQYYTPSGRSVCARRWRGRSGEIDLIARDGAEVIFIEVKQSSTHARAAEHLTERQMRRVYHAAEEFLAGEPLGLSTDVRFDIALVDGFGRIEVLENAYAA